MIDMTDIELIIGTCSNSRCTICVFASEDTLECQFDELPYMWDADKILEIIEKIKEKE